MSIEDDSGADNFPPHGWPVVDGHFKIIALLSPGANKLVFTRGHGSEATTDSLDLAYVPLLQTPPLHLAIMVARDSPLLIDCPPGKYGALSTAHSSLDAAVAKFRMTAYMWQALTAEDSRIKGLGRRSFRLEEEWGADTTSSEFLHGMHEDALYETGAMRSRAKVHIVRSEKTVAEIRDMDVAQQNESANRGYDLFDYFRQALTAHGSPFEASAHPVAAGLILDSHYSIQKDMILGHAALGCHAPKGLSLGIMGSHLTYSWPRFLEEVSSCLLDAGSPGPTVGNDNDECGSFWEACSVGQGAFLHEVGHAFGAPHTTGIMARGYSRHWPRNFVTQTAYCSSRDEQGLVVIDGETENNARWDLRESLMFRSLPHFWMPGDVKMPKEIRAAAPTVNAVDIDTDEPGLLVASAAGVGSIEFGGVPEPLPTISAPVDSIRYSIKELEERLSPNEPLKVSVLGMNGKSRTIGDVQRLFRNTSFIRIPGTSINLTKTSVLCKDLEAAVHDDGKFWKWATLLIRKGKDGTVKYATMVESRVGLVLDGAYVYFAGARINCGARVGKYNGERLNFGGHASEEICIPKGQEIVKVEVSRDVDSSTDCLRGLRIHLSNGKVGGALSGGYDEDYETSTLGELGVI